MSSLPPTGLPSISTVAASFRALLVGKCFVAGMCVRAPLWRLRPLIWQLGALTRVEKTLPSLLQTFWGQIFLPRMQEGRKEVFCFYYFTAARLELWLWRHPSFYECRYGRSLTDRLLTVWEVLSLLCFSRQPTDFSDCRRCCCWLDCRRVLVVVSYVKLSSGNTGVSRVFASFREAL